MFGYNQGIYNHVGNAMAAYTEALNNAAVAAAATSGSHPYAGYTTGGVASTTAVATAAQQQQQQQQQLTATYGEGFNPAAYGYGFEAIPTPASAAAYGGKFVPAATSAIPSSQSTSSAVASSSSTISRGGNAYDSVLAATVSNFWKSATSTSSGTAANKHNNYGRPGGGRSYGSGSGGGGGGGGAEKTQLYCKICNITAAGPLAFNSHLEGKTHKKREKENQNKDGDGRLGFRCEICSVTVATMDTYKAHIRGKPHTRSKELWLKMGKTLTSEEPVIIGAPKSGVSGAVSFAASAGPPPSALSNPDLGYTTLDPAPPPPPKPGDAATHKIIGIGRTNFVKAGLLTSTASGLIEEGPAVGGGDAGPAQQDPNATLGGEVGSTTSAATAAAGNPAQFLEEEIEPVGLEYITAERDARGKIVTFKCTLCNCDFTDFGAKDMHSKGRRHRLNYKSKVDPDYDVRISQKDMAKMTPEMITLARSSGAIASRTKAPGQKPQNQLQRMNAGKGGGGGGLDVMTPGVPAPGHQIAFVTRRGFDTADDLCVMAKHSTLVPREEELNQIERLITMVERGLKLVSDQLPSDAGKAQVEPAATATTAEKTGESDAAESSNGEKPPAADETEKSTTAVPLPPARERLLKGVMRVGAVANGLLVTGDTEVELVVLCSSPPTAALLDDVARLLPTLCERSHPSEQLSTQAEPQHAAVRVKLDARRCLVFFTCTSLRDDPPPAEEKAAAVGGEAAVVTTTPPQPATSLSRDACLHSLAKLRRSKWFAIRCSNLPNCTMTLRVLRDIRRRFANWAPLSDWMTELIVEKALATVGAPLSPGDALRRVLEVLASGVLYKTGPGVADPCEKGNVDVLQPLEDQQREDLTGSAQHALRMMAFKQSYRVLSMDKSAVNPAKRPSTGPLIGDVPVAAKVPRL